MISRDSIQSLLECAPHVTHKIVDLMSERCVHFLYRMEILARKGLVPRLATLLLGKAEHGVVAGRAPRACSPTMWWTPLRTARSGICWACSVVAASGHSQ
jgi:hypothetical protein